MSLSIFGTGDKVVELVGKLGAVRSLIRRGQLRGRPWDAAQFTADTQSVITNEALYGRMIRGTSYQHTHFGIPEPGRVLLASPARLARFRLDRIVRGVVKRVSLVSRLSGLQKRCQD